MTGINQDRSRQAVMRTATMDWQASPSPQVLRKRLELIGDAETGLVTSVVRYEPGSRFPEHSHPEGEEFFVLSGVFSDESGDHPAGSYVLNPPGTAHAPFSTEGCELFVKLRQYGGDGRPSVRVDTVKQPWAKVGSPGLEVLLLYRQHGFPETVRLMQLAADTHVPMHDHETGVEIFVLDGAFENGNELFAAGDWLRLPAGSRHGLYSAEGCRLYIKTGHLGG